MEYDGPCNSDMINFADFSLSSKKRWSNACKATWPCKSKAFFGEYNYNILRKNSESSYTFCCMISLQKRLFEAMSRGLG